MSSLRHILILLLAIAPQLLLAQKEKNEIPPVTFKGKITFERKLNLHKQMDEMMKGNGGANSAMADQLKKNISKYKTDIFEMYFNDTKSLYKPAPDGISEVKMMMAGIPSEKNLVYNDFTQGVYTSEKSIFEKTYLIQDSLKPFQWKITEEFRKIAGFNCRRAETVIMDSVYVVAFYTDAIMTNSGPENFSGLPGMILGIVMPRLNLTYFATKVENYLPGEKDIVSPTKGVKKDQKELESDLRSSMKQWGAFLERILWYCMI
ncbi:MAG: GLPGLI family protein [Chitinophagaceae bacterium]|nr:GLPGLI family protein [Chitinophagaceae bacterium]